VIASGVVVVVVQQDAGMVGDVDGAFVGHEIVKL